MIFRINTTRDISKFSQITYNHFEIPLVVFMPKITTNHAITYTNKTNIYWARCNNRDELWKILNSRFCHYVPKRGCVTALQFILFNFANYSPSIARELKVSKEITCKWQNQRFETNKYVSWALFWSCKQQGSTLKNC